MATQSVIKDYFQIAIFKKKELFFSFTTHQQVQDIYVYIPGYLLNPSEKTFFF